MKDARGQRGVGFSGGKDVAKVLYGAGAFLKQSREYGRPRSRRGGQFAVEAGAGSVGVQRGEQYFAGAAALRLRAPTS